MEKENLDLKNRLDSQQRVLEEATADKRKFMEGAVWMGKKMTAEVERVC